MCICKVIVEAFKSKVLNGLVGEELLCLTLSLSPSLITWCCMRKVIDMRTGTLHGRLYQPNTFQIGISAYFIGISLDCFYN